MPADSDFLTLRLGIGKDKLCVEVKSHANVDGFSMIDDDLEELAGQIIEETRYVDNIPVRVSLRDHQTIGIVGAKADTWYLRQHPKVLGLQFVDGIRRADRDNAIDVYISDEHDDVLGEDVWRNTFKVKPEVLTEEEKKAAALAAKEAEKAAKEAAKAEKEALAEARRMRADELREERAERARVNDSVLGRIKNTAISSATRTATTKLVNGLINGIFGTKKK
jgi:hypothetical protein